MQTTDTQSSATPTIDADLGELASLLWETIRGLKQGTSRPQEFYDAVAHESLGPRHMPALMAVGLAGPLSVTELARRLGLELSSTSAIVGDLSRAGLLERAEDENDRRRTIVAVHHDHAEIIGAWAAHALDPLRVTLERLTPEAREHFMQGWRILHEEATREPVNPDCEHDH